ncbi:hypothetical protein ATEIFO6365_0001006700 [Aspergillus terreus]|uniref:Uncharacterized protein n=1 Tax=Aspergillus terreus TaxID=33178 RepID=A0A5M3YQ27_ASPTE|nr:hypothetical protein ATETN484_0001006600 [Aspergillus terreus]GFF11847.1 hypothetical protein ATEIFO6365_0001006700 [Aspergillus terreus]
MSTYTDTPKVTDAFNETVDHDLPLNITPNTAYRPRYKKGDRVSNKAKAEVVETSTTPATLVQDDAGSIVYYLDFDANFQELATTRLMIF